MHTANRSAPGGPGIPARWTSSAKTGVGTALSNQSHVWFTLSHGVFNEIYYPRIDQACVRDMGLIVTDGASFFSEEKRDAGSEVEWLADIDARLLRLESGEEDQATREPDSHEPHNENRPPRESSAAANTERSTS